MSDLKVSELLPCDVRLPPATTIKAGCTVETLMLAISLEGRPRHFREGVKAEVTDASLTLEVAQLKQRVAELEGATRHYCENYLLDEHEDAELCLNAKHHQSVVALFAALKESLPHVR